MDLQKIRQNQFQTICQFSVPAINLGLPIVYLYLGLGLMISVGGSAIASMALGAGETEKGNAVFNQTMVTTVLVSFGVSLLAELPVLVINNGLGMFIRGEGNPRFFMHNCILNVLGNCILDYLLAGRLHMGIRGIAAASLISSCICLCFLIRYFRKDSIVYKFHKFVFDWKVLKNTVSNGVAEFIGEISMSITMFGYNFVIIKNIGMDGVTAFTIVGYVAYIFGMIILGFGQGISPLVSFAYGARDEVLAKGLRKKTNIYVLGIGMLVIMGMLFLSDWYSGIFVKNEVVRGMVKSGMPVFVLSFLFSGINTITAFYFTSIGKAKEAATISALRGLVILLICIFTLPILFGMTGVWMVAPVTEVITIPVCIWFLIKNDTIKNEEKGAEHVTAN